MLRLEEFSCGYADGFRLKPFSMEWETGCIGGIIGRNGSGKSTLLKGLMGDLPALTGKICLDGENLSELTLRERARRVASVQQFIHTAPISVEDYILLGRLPYLPRFAFSFASRDKEIGQGYTDMAGLNYLRRKYLTEISGGELQMVAVVRALVQEPTLLLLDEATSHLDISYQSRIIRLLKEVHRRRELSILMVIHDLNQAAGWCDSLTLVKSGQVIAHGSAEEVLTPTLIREAYDAEIRIHTDPYTGRPILTTLD